MTLRKRRLGSQGLEVGAIGLGCMTAERISFEMRLPGDGDLLGARGLQDHGVFADRESRIAVVVVRRIEL